jgi:glycerophosphoryl diester phosphodiesterase
MKHLFTFLLLLGCLAGAYAQPQIIAHRGYWDKLGSATNSLSSLKNAIDMNGVYGSEFDVHITKDGVLVVNHDDSYQGVAIHTSNYEDLAALRLANGEPLPVLQQYIETAKKQNKTKLIVEIKAHHAADADIRVADAVVKAVNEGGIADMVDYISFSADVCKELIRLNPSHRVAYLNGDKTPQELKKEGYCGLVYEQNVLKKNPAWIKEAKALGLTVNVWTVNKIEDMQYFIAAGIDFITTDNPQLLKGLLNK